MKKWRLKTVIAITIIAFLLYVIVTILRLELTLNDKVSKELPEEYSQLIFSYDTSQFQNPRTHFNDLTNPTSLLNYADRYNLCIRKINSSMRSLLDNIDLESNKYAISGEYGMAGLDKVEFGYLAEKEDPISKMCIGLLRTDSLITKKSDSAFYASFCQTHIYISYSCDEVSSLFFKSKQWKRKERISILVFKRNNGLFLAMMWPKAGYMEPSLLYNLFFN